MTPTVISVINQSQRISDDDVERMTHAVSKQLASDVAPIWGLVPALEFVKSGGKPTAGSCPCYVIDTPDIDDALGYHDEGSDGVPYIKVFVDPTLDNGGTALAGDNAVSVTLSHEVLELLGDSPANKWADGPKGVDYAFELCDAVEGDVYEVDGVSVSNFVYPAFFDPHAAHGERLDHLRKLTRSFAMTSGGYQITRTEPGTIAQVFAAATSHSTASGIRLHFGPDMPEWKRRGIINKHDKLRRRRPRAAA